MRALTTFRDPGGTLEMQVDVVVRRVRPDDAATLDRFLATDLARGWQEEGVFVRVDKVGATEQDGACYTSPRLPFVSHPAEWPAEMLVAAAELTLAVHEGLVAEGWGLKDATPLNVQFRGPRAVFVDVLSPEPRDPTSPLWTAYGQFVRTFLLPLLAARRQGRPVHETLLARRDGLTPDEVAPTLGPLRRWLLPDVRVATVPALLARRAQAKGGALPERRVSPERARFTLQHVVGVLRRDLHRLAPKGTVSHWSGYDAGRTHYDDAARQAKDEAVLAMLDAAAPSSVLDVGANTGRFSVMAAKAGRRVTAIDRDPAVVGVLWRRAVAEDLDILPLVVDLTRPTPAVGWANAETPSFLERAAAGHDAVLALAVAHHVVAGERVPVEAFLGCLRGLAGRSVIVERVGPGDALARAVAHDCTDRLDSLALEPFVTAAEAVGLVERERVALPGMDRSVHLFRKA